MNSFASWELIVGSSVLIQHEFAIGDLLDQDSGAGLVPISSQPFQVLGRTFAPYFSTPFPHTQDKLPYQAPLYVSVAPPTPILA